MRKEIAKSVALLFGLVLMSSLVLGATTVTDVKITPILQPGTDYAIVNVDVTVDASPTNYVSLYYKFPGSLQINSEFSSNGKMSFIYYNLPKNFAFDYKIQVQNDFSPTVYYPNFDGWATYSNGNNIVPATTQETTTPTTSTTTTTTSTTSTINTNPNTTTTQTTTLVNTTNSAPITGSATNTNSGIMDFAKTTAGTVSIAIVALVLLIVIVRLAKRSKKVQTTAEVVRTSE